MNETPDMSNTPKPNWILLRKVAGVCLLLIGFIVLVTPFTPGAPWFLIIGGQLLGLEFLSHERLKAYYKQAQSWWYWRKVEKEFLEIEEKKEEKTGS